MITTFKFCARAIFSLLEKTHPPGSQNLSSRNFSLFYIISTQRNCIYKKADTNRCFAKLRALSNLFSFFLNTLYIEYRLVILLWISYQHINQLYYILHSMTKLSGWLRHCAYLLVPHMIISPASTVTSLSVFLPCLCGIPRGVLGRRE